MGEAEPRTGLSLYYLIYVSKATQTMSGKALNDLQKQSRSFNRSSGLSGCLVYQDGYFMQMLEGKRETVLALMDKVRTDPRHKDVRIVIEGPARRRVFQDWGMALRDLTQETEGIDFAPWQRRSFTFADLAEDARACYGYMTAYAAGGISG
jgi:hypothetical protein